MTAIQLNAEILRNLGALAEDEGMLKRVAKYLRKSNEVKVLRCCPMSPWMNFSIEWADV